MKEEIKKLLVKAEGLNKEALDAAIMLANIYTYGLYGEKKDLETAKFWSNKAKEFEQKLTKVYDVQKKETDENIKKDNVYTNRFDNIQNNLKFVGTKDNINDKQSKTKTNRFDNIQNNLKFVTTKDIISKK